MIIELTDNFLNFISKISYFLTKSDFFFISINQIDTCHTTDFTQGGWFIHLFKKHLKIEKIK